MVVSEERHTRHAASLSHRWTGQYKQQQQLISCYYVTKICLSLCLYVHQFEAKTGEGVKMEKVRWDVGWDGLM